MRRHDEEAAADVSVEEGERNDSFTPRDLVYNRRRTVPKSAYVILGAAVRSTLGLPPCVQLLPARSDQHLGLYIGIGSFISGGGF